MQVVNSPGSGGDSTGRSRHASNDSNSSAPMWDEVSLPDPLIESRIPWLLLFLSSQSPSKFRTKTDNDRQQYKELRRASHITAEQKRRFNIKVSNLSLFSLYSLHSAYGGFWGFGHRWASTPCTNWFPLLAKIRIPKSARPLLFRKVTTIPPCGLLDSAVSVMLLLKFTGAEYCTKLKDDRARMQKEMEVLKQEIESLNSAIR